MALGLLGFVVYLPAKPTAGTVVPSLFQATLYNASYRMLWSIGVAIMIFLCSVGCGGYDCNLELESKR